MNKPIRVVEGTARAYEPFWRVVDSSETGGDPEIEFYGYISEYSWMGDEITPKKFREDLYSAGKGGPVKVRINSGGGEIFAASAIRSTLADYPGRVTVRIDGLAASAAVAVALAGDRIEIADTAYMMIHNPGYAVLMGYLEAEILEQMAAELRLFKEGLLNAYETRTAMTREELSGLMDAETWMTAQQAVEYGFADEMITGGIPMKKQDLAKAILNYVNIPPALINAAGEEDMPETDDGGQEPPSPSTAEKPTQQARARLDARATIKVQGVPNMNYREMLKQREAMVSRAQELVDLADNEGRDFSEEEREEFQRILGTDEEAGELGALDAKITQIQAERERLRAAAEKPMPTAGAEKPDGQKAKLMKRAEFDALNQAERAAFIKAGGKLED